MSRFTSLASIFRPPEHDVEVVAALVEHWNHHDDLALR
jgi:hypothetical protein